MKKPIDDVRELWGREDDEDFESVMRRCINSGVFYSGPDACLMAEKIGLDRLGINKSVDKECWWVYAYSGKLKTVLKLVPYRLKYVGFRRRSGENRVYELKKLLRKIKT